MHCGGNPADIPGDELLEGGGGNPGGNPGDRTSGEALVDVEM